jgi:site-specific DNA recombinase
MTAPILIPPKRCAVYCRVSSDEGLDQAFNSIDAQKEAGHAFIASQRAEGWIPVPDDYEDAAYSGGNMDRPGLKRLLADIEFGRVDVIVVYKIDRLSRSLSDFAKMVDIFDRHGVSFSAVTQQINSATSMGRLMLNVLLSFAQFEREVTGERIRDKFAASKAKGMWMGGVVPMGYRVQDRRLLVVPQEAEVIRRVFRDYARTRCTTDMVRNFMAEGITTKRGMPFGKQAIYKILHNRLYLGEMIHKGKSYPGEHAAIVDRGLWDAAHEVLSIDTQERKSRTLTRNSPVALLRGLLYAPNGMRMIPNSVRKKAQGGKRYRYYLDGKNGRYGKGADTFGTLAADQIEGLVVEHVIAALRSPASVQAVWDAVRGQTTDIGEPGVVLAMGNLGAIWQSLFPAEQVRIVNLLIERVQLTQDSVEIQWRQSGWSSLVGEFKTGTIGAELAEMESQ